MYWLGLICVAAAIILLIIGFSADPSASKLTDAGQLETEDKVFIKAKGDDLNIEVPEGTSEGIDGYRKMFVGKFTVRKIDVGGRDVAALMANNSSFMGNAYAVVSRTKVPALDALLSEYEAENGAAFGSYAVIHERFSSLMYVAIFVLLLGFILIRPAMKAITKAAKQKNEYV
jgi:hypothetical protein